MSKHITASKRKPPLLIRGLYETAKSSEISVDFSLTSLAVFFYWHQLMSFSWITPQNKKNIFPFFSPSLFPFSLSKVVHLFGHVQFLILIWRPRLCFNCMQKIKNKIVSFICIMSCSDFKFWSLKSLFGNSWLSYQRFCMKNCTSIGTFWI